MKGRNKIWVNQATMQVIVGQWLYEALQDPAAVVSVKAAPMPGGTQHNDGFEITIESAEADE
jgi:hypothetical protein